MDATRWTRVQTLFHATVDMPPAEQQRYLETQCDDDPSLVGETLSLLAEDARGTPLLDQGVAAIAQDMFGPTASAAPNQSFGPYRLTRMLGEGGMGVVYLGQRDDLGSVAAIKILRDAWLSPARRERFAAEQRTLAQLNHPLIARLYDAGALPDGTPWFVMEYVEGAPLTTYCRSHALPLRDRLRLFRSVCEAVQHAHQHLVVHRDLKPSNILVTEDGRVKLLDFGIAKQLEGAGRPAEQTRTALRLLTPAYAAPEQITGGQIGIHTDVYALGVILYELLTGALPFDRNDIDSPEAVSGVARVAERPSLAAKRRTTPSATADNARRLSAVEWADLDVLALRAMHDDPTRRYATVDALIRDVDHFLAGEPLEARPDSVRYRVGKFVRRNRQAVAATATLAVLIVSLVVYYTVTLTRARNEALAESERAQRIQRFTLNLFEGGDKVAGPAESLRVVTLLDRGLQEARALGAEPSVEAELYVTLGGIYQQLGNFARADSLLTASLEIRRRLFGPSHPDVAASLVALSALRGEQAKFEEAERLAREGLEMARRTLPANRPEIAKASVALGNVLQARGQYDKAIPVLDDAVRMYSKTGVSADLASSLSALADAQFYAGHYDVSDSLNRRVLPVYRQLYGDRHPRVADALLNLAATAFDRGEYANAERLDRQALEITTSFYGPDSHQAADVMTILGRVFVRAKRPDEAATLLRQALAIRERVYGKMHPSVASTLNELGNVAVRRNEFDEAEKNFRRMLDIYHATYGDKHFLIGTATSNLGGVYHARGQYQTADSLFRAAVRMFVATQGENHVNTAIARVKLGRTLLAEHRFRDAVAESGAGHDLLAKQAPSSTFLEMARQDLIAEYDSLTDAANAARIRAEVASVGRR
jgi:serine/threonine protein kinase/tetratricopeptide (TPR) repeat protein